MEELRVDNIMVNLLLQKIQEDIIIIIHEGGVVVVMASPPPLRDTVVHLLVVIHRPVLPLRYWVPLPIRVTTPDRSWPARAGLYLEAGAFIFRAKGERLWGITKRIE